MRRKQSSLFALLIICLSIGLAVFTVGKILSDKPVRFPIQANVSQESATKHLAMSGAIELMQGGRATAQMAASKREQSDQLKAARPHGSVRDEDRLRRVAILIEALRGGRGVYGSPIR